MMINSNGNVGKGLKSVNRSRTVDRLRSLFINLIKTKAVRFQSVSVMRVLPDFDFVTCWNDITDRFPILSMTFQLFSDGCQSIFATPCRTIKQRNRFLKWIPFFLFRLISSSSVYKKMYWMTDRCFHLFIYFLVFFLSRVHFKRPRLGKKRTWRS